MTREYQIDSTYINETTDDEYQLSETYINETVEGESPSGFQPYWARNVNTLIGGGVA